MYLYSLVCCPETRLEDACLQRLLAVGRNSARIHQPNIAYNELCILVFREQLKFLQQSWLNDMVRQR